MFENDEGTIRASFGTTKQLSQEAREREKERERGPNGGRNILEILSLSSLIFFCSSFLRLSAAFVGLVCLMGSRPGSTTTTTFDQVSPKREEDCGESR